MYGQFTLHHQFRIDTGRTKCKVGKTDSSSQPWIPSVRITGFRKSMIWANHVSHRTSKSGKGKGYGLWGRLTACSTERNEAFINKMYRNLFYDTLPAFFSNVVVKSWTRRYMCHFDHLPRFPSKIFGWKNWIQKSLEAAKIPNESSQNQKPN